jgi:eukaryotic-like serine/threonine-protein kinase
MENEVADTGERFELRGELGIGATGAVYRVFDRQRGEEVALKTLRRVSGADLYRFKREFRALAGVHHPNLATLHELFVVGNEWMFTMELVDGVRFDEYVRPGGQLDEVRLRDALRQLVDGLCALHAIGKIHRDLKPSNVLVDRGGRTVILDFGLAVPTENADRTHEGGSVGTIAYMSPEQAADLPLTEATDWYAVGVMLHEALVGVRPIRGSPQDIFLRKQIEEAPALENLAGAPEDLAELCTLLLDRNPELRADGDEVLAALGADISPATRAIAQAASARKRIAADHAGLVVLRDALAASREHFVVVVVRGGRGTGKTALLDTFVDEVRERHEDALVLTTRDNAREQTPLPGVDQAVDQLSAFLLGLSRRDAEEILHDAAPLARIFPALRRIPLLQMPTLPQAKAAPPADPFGDGIRALRRVLHRISVSRPVLWTVDDGRGPGPERARLLTDHLATGIESERPRVLIVTALHPDAVEGNALLANMIRWRDEKNGDLRFIDLP